jgi:hypothetical protein
MLKKAVRLTFVTLALLFSLTAPFAPAAYADCAGAPSGTICPR